MSSAHRGISPGSKTCLLRAWREEFNVALDQMMIPLAESNIRRPPPPCVVILHMGGGTIYASAYAIQLLISSRRLLCMCASIKLAGRWQTPSQPDKKSMQTSPIRSGILDVFARAYLADSSCSLPESGGYRPPYMR